MRLEHDDYDENRAEMDIDALNRIRSEKTPMESIINLALHRISDLFSTPRIVTSTNELTEQQIQQELSSGVVVFDTKLTHLSPLPPTAYGALSDNIDNTKKE